MILFFFAASLSYATISITTASYVRVQCYANRECHERSHTLRIVTLRILILDCTNDVMGAFRWLTATAELKPKKYGQSTVRTKELFVFNKKTEINKLFYIVGIY